MAFTGTATIKQISDNEVRITGLSLASAAAGVIGLSGSGREVELPAAFQPKPYTYEGATVGFLDSIDVTVKNAATGVATAIPLSIVKSGASTVAAWICTITNTHGSLTCEEQEIYIKYHS